jgi:hypothetical protein
MGVCNATTSSTWSDHLERDITFLTSRDCSPSSNRKPVCYQICSLSHVASATNHSLHLIRYSLITLLLNLLSWTSKTSLGVNIICLISSSGGNSVELVTRGPNTFSRLLVLEVDYLPDSKVCFSHAWTPIPNGGCGGSFPHTTTAMGPMGATTIFVSPPGGGFEGNNPN